MPDRGAVERLTTAAARCYGAPSAGYVVAAPGTQSLLPHVVRLVPPGRAAILRTTYAEHARAAVLAGHTIIEATDSDQLRDAGLTIVVNPNNPDGRIVAAAKLRGLAQDLARRGGLLVIDESFADVAPAGTSLAADVVLGNVVVLRSFGKFFGLAGLRLGFALAAPHLIRRLEASLGPWAVAGPALLIGETALTDAEWRRRMLMRLGEAAGRLDGLLTQAGLELAGGTILYRLTRSPRTTSLFQHLGRAGIFVRRFREHSDCLRWGMPGDEPAWQRLGVALDAFDGAEISANV